MILLDGKEMYNQLYMICFIHCYYVEMFAKETFLKFYI